MVTTDVWNRDELDLAITGMTCTSCAARVEKKLNKLPGVTASVNYATETAHVVMGPDTVLADVLRTVEQAGYGASLLDDSQESTAEVDSLRRRFWAALVLALPVAALAMVPVLQFPGWQWVSLALTTPVVAWAAWPFHRAAGLNARHGVATMDTLVSVGILAAFGWSVWALIFGGAGALDYTMSHGLFAMNHGGPPDLYFEVAAAVPVFLLAGRWFEARAKRRSTAAPSWTWPRPRRGCCAMAGKCEWPRVRYKSVISSSCVPGNASPPTESWLRGRVRSMPRC